MLIKQGTDWQSAHESCKEHLLVKVSMAGLGDVYLWTGSGVRKENEQMVNCLKRDITKFKYSGEIILLVDMNAHIEDLDGYTDHSGCLVLDLCHENQLVIVKNVCPFPTGNRGELEACETL